MQNEPERLRAENAALREALAGILSSLPGHAGFPCLSLTDPTIVCRRCDAERVLAASDTEPLEAIYALMRGYTEFRPDPAVMDAATRLFGEPRP